MADRSAAPLRAASVRRLTARFGLSARLLLLTVIFVMLAEVLIYVPSVANFRRNWLADRLAAARIAALVVDAAPGERLGADLEARLLEGVGAVAIAVRGGGTRRLLSRSDMPPKVDRDIDLRDAPWQMLIADAFAVLAAPAANPIRVVGHGAGGSDFVEAILDEAPLRAAMLEFSRNILLLSLFISALTAGLVYLALQLAIVRPVRRLSANVASFAQDPEDVSRIIAPSARTDEIGVAEQALASMETTLAEELRQKRRLAELGLAVSKINHELRNMLTTAQLLADRLDGVADPAAQRVLPRLLGTLGRAIEFCEATLAYGRAAERLPERRLVPLAPVVEELADLVGLAPGAAIAFEPDVADGLLADADPDQLSRVLVNLVRNAVQALSQAGSSGAPPRIEVTAARKDGRVTILVCDNGPGVPERVKPHLFSAFRGAARSGGAGLGLAIAAEIARLHGGSLTLDDVEVGTRFRLVVPDRA